jgi:hypothetical protein
VSSFRFVGEVVDVFAILPTRHPLVVMASPIFLPDALRIPDEERPDPLLHTEGDDLASGFMSQVTDTAHGAARLLVLGTLQFLPATGILLAPVLLPGKVAQLLRTLPFEWADLASGDDQGLAGRRRDRCQVNLSEVNGGLSVSWSSLRLCYLNTDMQLKATVPDQRAGTTVFG